jgi:hypothetical protein
MTSDIAWQRLSKFAAFVVAVVLFGGCSDDGESEPFNPAPDRPTTTMTDEQYCMSAAELSWTPADWDDPAMVESLELCIARFRD